jgi:hypothetical protein
LSTLLQRAAGAATFRGALEAGSQKIQLEREQTAFQRAQAEKTQALAERRVGAEERQAGAEEQRNANMLTDSALRSSTEFGIESMRENLERQLRSQKPEMSEGDYIKVAMDMVPHLLSTMEFEPNMTAEQKMQAATDQALKSMMLMRNMLKSDSRVVRDPTTGQMFIDDGKGNRQALPGGPKPKPQPEPIAAPKPQPKPSGPSAFVGPQDQEHSFAPTLSEKVRGLFVGGGARPTSEERDFPTASLFPQYMRMFREARSAGGGYDREAVGMLGRLGDAQLQTMGMAPDEIQTLRDVQKGL